MQRRTFASLSLLGLTLPLLPRLARAQSAAAAPLTAQQVAANVDKLYNQLRTYKASFKQRFAIPSHGKTKDSGGSVIFEKPGKMSWQYTNGNRVVSDGQVISVYEKADKQMHVQPLGASQYPAALSFLTGQGSLSQGFRLSLHSSAQAKSPGYVLKGVPLQPTASYAHVYFYVDAKTFHVRRVLLEDVQGNRNRFDFESPLVNRKPPPGTFVFAPPPGTQVIKH